MKNLFLILIIISSGFSCNQKRPNINEKMKNNLQSTPRVYFKWPKDNSTVSSPVFIDMGLDIMKVEAAGIVKKGFGHHHILINQYYWPKGSIIPMSDSTLHYGLGQTDTSLDLLPGDYVVSLQFADGVHASYGKELSSSIEANL